MLPMLNRAGKRLLGQTENLPTVYPPKNDPASKQTYLGVPTPPGNASLEAFIAKHPTDALNALKDDRAVHAIGDPTLERKFSLLYDRPYAVDASVPPTSPRHVARGPRALPGQPPQDGPGVRDEVLDDRHREPPDLVRRVLRDVPRRVVQRDLGDERRPPEARERRRPLRAARRGPAAADLGPARLVRRVSQRHGAHRCRSDPADGAPRAAEDAEHPARPARATAAITAAAWRR